MTRSVVEAGGFRSLLFMRSVATPQDAPLAIFIEGDGVPWRGGMEPSLDPTTADPIALKLLAQTPPPAAYVSRPCYQDMSGAAVHARTLDDGALLGRDRLEHDRSRAHCRGTR